MYVWLMENIHEKGIFFSVNIKYLSVVARVIQEISDSRIEVIKEKLKKAITSYTDGKITDFIEKDD